MLRRIFAVLLFCHAAAALALPFASRHVLVVEADSGQVLLAKNADVEVPIASLTKLMTAMVVLDANPDLDEAITVEDPRFLAGAHSRTRLRDGSRLPRRTVLELALMSSDNHAAVSLAYAYPGGIEAFGAAVAAKIDQLGMTRTRIEEPTGLSERNRSTAEDLARMAAAAASYPEIVRITTTSGALVDVGGRNLEYHNTNHLVGKAGWDILLSKTGFTIPAGRCLIMGLKNGSQTVFVVLLNAVNTPSRMLDAVNVRRYLAGEQPLLAAARHSRHASRHAGRIRSRLASGAKSPVLAHGLDGHMKLSAAPALAH